MCLSFTLTSMEYQMSYLTYLLVGWVFLHEIYPGRRAHYVNYENINNSNLDGMSLASFCQSRAQLASLLSFLFLVMGSTHTQQISHCESHCKDIFFKIFFGENAQVSYNMDDELFGLIQTSMRKYTNSRSQVQCDLYWEVKNPILKHFPRMTEVLYYLRLEKHVNVWSLGGLILWNIYDALAHNTLGYRVVWRHLASARRKIM